MFEVDAGKLRENEVEMGRPINDVLEWHRPLQGNDSPLLLFGMMIAVVGERERERERESYK
jgi:hypothetical protein